MRLMAWIRKYAIYGLWVFLGLFVISVFAGLGQGAFNLGGRSGNPAQQTSAGRYAAPVNPQQPEVALVVNGRKVESKQFYERVNNYQQMMRSQLDDPQMMLYVYGQTANSLIQEEVLLAKAQELGVKVTAEDLAEERQKVVDAQGTPEAKPSGNVLGGFTQSLGKQRERKSVFNAAISRMGLTKEQWEVEMTRQILQRKAREAMQKELDDAKDVAAKAKRDQVDAELAKGAEFKTIATKYSDAEDSAKLGGDMTPSPDGWLLPGLLSDEINEDKNDKVLFATKTGEITPWFDVPAGYQRWQVYDRQPVDATEFESVKAKLTDQLKKEKGAEYAPTDDELKALAFKIKARQIMINKTDPAGLPPIIEKLNKAATVEINNPYVLAYQALYDEKLQPPAGIDYDKLVTIAQKSKVGASYNFDKIKGKLERGQPAAAEPAATSDESDTAAAPAAATAEPAAETPAGGEPPASPEAAAAAPEPVEDAAAPATPDPAKPEVDDDPAAPIYALGVGLLELALEGDAVDNGSFGQAIIAKIYLDWLDNAATLDEQPVDRDAARLEIETRLARALEKDDYNAVLYADRGLNLAWLNKPEEAKQALELAEKYATDQEGGPLSKVKEAYEKLDMQDKVAEIQARLDAARQKAMQEQIERAMAQQQQQQAAGGGAAGQPIQIDMGGGGG